MLEKHTFREYIAAIIERTYFEAWYDGHNNDEEEYAFNDWMRSSANFMVEEMINEIKDKCISENK